MQKTQNFKPEQILDLKVMQFFKSINSKEDAGIDMSTFQDQIFSLSDLMQKTPEFLQQSVFKLIFSSEHSEENRFKYIQLKIKSIITGHDEQGNDEISTLI